MSEPRRILAVMASLMGGGAERQMVLLLNNLDRSRFTPTLCLLALEGEFLGELSPDVRVIGLGKQAPRDAARLVGRLARVMRAEGPDVVLAKVDYANTIAALAARLARCSAPLVLCEESVPSAALSVASHAWLRRRLLRWSYLRARHVVAPSPGVADDLQAALRIDRSAITVIPNMLDTAAITRAAGERIPLDLGSQCMPLLVTAGRLMAGKGQDDLLRAMPLVNAVHPCMLVLLGEGPERHRLEELAASLGLNGKVRFTGFLTNPFAVMARAAAFVSPSHVESFGNVIIEAMAVGVPVVSTRVLAGPRWLISDGETGVFSEPGNPEDLACQILRVLENPELGRLLVVRARTAVRRFDAGNVSRQYEQLLA